MCHQDFLDPLNLFLSRTAYSINPHIPSSSLDKSETKYPSLKRSNSKKSKGSSSVTYTNSNISRADLPPIHLSSSPPPMTSLVLDTRSSSSGSVKQNQSSSSGSQNQTRDKDPPQDSDAIEMTILTKLETLDWSRLALVPGKKELDLENPLFWTFPASQPLLKSIVSLLINDTHTLPYKSALLPLDDNDSVPIHLVVLIHGLDGYDSDMHFIASKLTQRYPDHSLHTLCPTCNHGKTYDGILAGSTRILQQVVLEIGRIGPRKCKYISVIGHSLGGLYGRCLLGLMHDEGIVPLALKPMTFISLATPHLGSREHAKILGGTLTSVILGNVIGLTGSGTF